MLLGSQVGRVGDAALVAGARHVFQRISHTFFPVVPQISSPVPIWLYGLYHQCVWLSFSNRWNGVNVFSPKFMKKIFFSQKTNNLFLETDTTVQWRPVSVLVFKSLSEKWVPSVSVFHPLTLPSIHVFGTCNGENCGIICWKQKLTLID